MPQRTGPFGVPTNILVLAALILVGIFLLNGHLAAFVGPLQDPVQPEIPPLPLGSTQTSGAPQGFVFIKEDGPGTGGPGTVWGRCGVGTAEYYLEHATTNITPNNHKLILLDRSTVNLNDGLAWLEDPASGEDTMVVGSYDVNEKGIHITINTAGLQSLPSATAEPFYFLVQLQGTSWGRGEYLDIPPGRWIIPPCTTSLPNCEVLELNVPPGEEMADCRDPNTNLRMKVYNPGPDAEGCIYHPITPDPTTGRGVRICQPAILPGCDVFNPHAQPGQMMASCEDQITRQRITIYNPGPDSEGCVYDPLDGTRVCQWELIPEVPECDEPNLGAQPGEVLTECRDPKTGVVGAIYHPGPDEEGCYYDPLTGELLFCEHVPTIPQEQFAPGIRGQVLLGSGDEEVGDFFASGAVAVLYFCQDGPNLSCRELIEEQLTDPLGRYSFGALLGGAWFQTCARHDVLGLGETCAVPVQAREGESVEADDIVLPFRVDPEWMVMSRVPSFLNCARHTTIVNWVNQLGTNPFCD